MSIKNPKKPISYFLRTQSHIINGEKLISFNSYREKSIKKKQSSKNKKKFSNTINFNTTGNKSIKTKRYISNNPPSNYRAIDLNKVSGFSHPKNKLNIPSKINTQREIFSNEENNNEIKDNNINDNINELNNIKNNKKIENDENQKYFNTFSNFINLKDNNETENINHNNKNNFKFYNNYTKVYYLESKENHKEPYLNKNKNNVLRKNNLIKKENIKERIINNKNNK